MAFVPKQLSVGSAGPEVRQIQDDLNLLPSMWPPLTPSGVFDLATRNRTMEFQLQAHIFPDGIVDPATRGRLIDMIAKRSQTIGTRSEATPTPWHRGTTARVSLPVINPGLPPDPTWAMRGFIVEIAEAEAKAGGANRVAAAMAAARQGSLPAATLQQLASDGVVAAKLQGAKDAKNRNTRMGHEKLLNYFHSVGLNSSDDAIRHFGQVQGADNKMHDDFDNLFPLPHWCGIFALWVYKTAGMKVGDWKVGGGIGDVGPNKKTPDFLALPDKKQARKGDIGYFDKIVPPATQAFQHHFILKEVHKDGSLVTIEGNSDPKSNFNIKTDRTLDSLTAVYTARELKVV